MGRITMLPLGNQKRGTKDEKQGCKKWFGQAELLLQATLVV